MDREQLEVFVDTVNLGSFNRCAEERYMTRMAVKRLMDALESEARVPLLTRGAKGVEPTVAGMAFYGRATSILKSMTEALEAARNAADDKTIRLGAHPLRSAVLSSLAKRFMLQYPAYKVIVHPLDKKRPYHAVRDGSCDICEGTSPEIATAYDLAFFATGPYGCYCAVACDDALAGYGAVSLGGLTGRCLGFNVARMPFIAEFVKATEGEGTTCEDFELAGAGLTRITQFINEGGCFVLPSEMCYLFENNYALVRLDGLGDEVCSGVFTRPNPPEHLRAFIDALRELRREEAR